MIRGLFLCAAFTVSAVAQTAPAPIHKPRLFVVDKVSTTSSASAGPGLFGTTQASASTGETHTAPGVIVWISKKCPDALTITTDRATADYILATNEGASVISNPAGDIVFTSKAYTYRGLSKDVCKFMGSQH